MLDTPSHWLRTPLLASIFAHINCTSNAKMPEMCANPLLLQWPKEWYDGARERNSKGATTYGTADCFKRPLLIVTGIGRHTIP